MNFLNCVQLVTNNTNYTYKMKQYTIRKEIMISEKQKETLSILSNYGINLSQFIRQAIKEKIKRDWKGIKLKKERKDINAPDWIYS